MPAPVLNWSIDGLKQLLDVYFPDSCVEVLAQTSSTNTLLLERVRRGDTRPSLLIAERQTAGRGRMQRLWQSSQTAGNTLTFSLSVPMLPIQHISSLSVAVGCALAESLDAKQKFALQIKWPNDIWYQQRKLAGILIELCTKGKTVFAVVGIGINIAPLQLIQCKASNQKTAWVREFLPQVQAPEILGLILPTLANMLANFGSENEMRWRQFFQVRDALKDKAVNLSDGTCGIAQGIRDDGALRLKTEHEMRYITSAEVSVRAKP